MPERSSRYIKVDELVPQVTLEQVALFYRVQLPPIKQVANEIRLRCFLVCGRTEETGDRALAIDVSHPAKQWKCHQYGCARSGNLVSLIDLIKPGDSGNGRPRGDRFKAIARDVQSMVEGRPAPNPPDAAALKCAAASAAPEERPRNVPMEQSSNERARALLSLDREFVTDPAAMPPEAARYFRQRPFLTPEACSSWRVGYLPHSSKSLLRGKIVYGYMDPVGNLLTWFGRDPRFEQKIAAWRASDRSGPEPIKTQFVKGFHRGLELYGEHLVRAEADRGAIPGIGLVLVEGPNDAIRLHALDVPAVAVCSNTITREQAEKAAALAQQLSVEGVVTLLFDCDEEGRRGAEQALKMVAEFAPVRVGWTHVGHSKRFDGRQPESLSDDEWHALSEALARG